MGNKTEGRRREAETVVVVVKEEVHYCFISGLSVYAEFPVFVIGQPAVKNFQIISDNPSETQVHR